MLFASSFSSFASSEASNILNSSICIDDAIIFEGNISFLLIKSFTAELYALRAHCSLSSISDHCVCNSKKFVLAFKSG